MLSLLDLLDLVNNKKCIIRHTYLKHLQKKSNQHIVHTTMIACAEHSSDIRYGYVQLELYCY